MVFLESRSGGVPSVSPDLDTISEQYLFKQQKTFSVFALPEMIDFVLFVLPTEAEELLPGIIYKIDRYIEI